METLPDLAAAQSRHLLVEFAGVFWLAAELALLHLVRLGREHLEHSPRSPKLSPSRGALIRARFFIALVVALLVVVLGRRCLPLPANDLSEMIHFERAHLLVWSAFVTGWVVLEGLIVYHGWRGHIRLRALLGGLPPAGPPRALAAGVLIAGALVMCTLAMAEHFSSELDRALEPARNAVYFYLRVAGVAWVMLEWCAVWVLWRAYALLRSVEATR